MFINNIENSLEMMLYVCVCVCVYIYICMYVADLQQMALGKRQILLKVCVVWDFK